MNWKAQHKNLYVRLLGTTKVSEMALDKQITRLASSKSITAVEALFVLARKNNLQFTRDFAKLPADSQNRVTNAVSSSIPAIKVKAVPARYKNTILTIKTPLGKITDPYLPDSIFKDAIAVSQNAYPYLYILENSVRHFISLFFENKYGSDWWNQKIQGTNVLDNIHKKATDRTAKETANSYHSKRGAAPIYYVDFEDLISIMCAYEKDLNPLFKNLTGKLNGMLNKLEEITPSRNVVAHHNPLSDKDNNRVFGYLHDWLGQLEYIKSQGLL